MSEWGLEIISDAYIRQSPPPTPVGNGEIWQYEQLTLSHICLWIKQAVQGQSRKSCLIRFPKYTKFKAIIRNTVLPVISVYSSCICWNKSCLSSHHQLHVVSSCRDSSHCWDATGAAPLQQAAWWPGFLLQTRQKGESVCPSVHSQKSRVGLLSCCRTPEWLRLAQTLFHLLQPCSSRDTQSRVPRAVSRQVLEISKEESPQPLATCTSCPSTAKVPHSSSVLHSDRTGLYHICLPWLRIAQDFFRVKGWGPGVHWHKTTSPSCCRFYEEVMLLPPRSSSLQADTRWLSAAVSIHMDIFSSFLPKATNSLEKKKIIFKKPA